MTLFEFGGTPTEVAEDPSTGKAAAGVRATLWTAETGGTQWTTGVTDLIGGGVGGTIISGAFGRWRWSINDPTDQAANVWLQPEGISGAPGVRWLVRSHESYGPTGPQGLRGPQGDPGPPFPLPAGTAAPGSVPILNDTGDGTIWADPTSLPGGSGAGGYEGAAPGSILRWPTPDKADQLLPRPTSRLDVTIRWYLPAAPPEGGGYSIPGVDEWVDTSA